MRAHFRLRPQKFPLPAEVTKEVIYVHVRCIVTALTQVAPARQKCYAFSCRNVKALSTSPAGVSCRQSTCSCRQSMCSCRQSTCLMPSVNVFMPAASSLRSLRGVVWDLQYALYRTEINVSCGYHQLDRSRSPKMHCILLVYSPLRRLGQLTLHSASIQPVETTRSAHTAFC